MNWFLKQRIHDLLKEMKNGKSIGDASLSEAVQNDEEEMLNLLR